MVYVIFVSKSPRHATLGGKLESLGGGGAGKFGGKQPCLVENEAFGLLLVKSYLKLIKFTELVIPK